MGAISAGGFKLSFKDGATEIGLIQGLGLGLCVCVTLKWERSN